MTSHPPIIATDPHTGFSEHLTEIDSTPIPLACITQPPKYPIEALGGLLGDAAKALAHHVQTPLGMAGQAVLAVASLAVQGHINVSKGNAGASPTTLYCLTIAASGERKSSLDRLAMKAIYEFQAERRAAHEDLMAEYRADLEAHEQRHRSTVNAYRGTGVKGKALTEDDEKLLSEDLADLEKKRPIQPPRPHVLMEEPTAEGIYRHLQEGLPVAGLFSDEGLSFFNGHGMVDEAMGRSITMLSQLWDGKPITRTRAGAGDSGVLAGRRLATHLMVQPIIADKVLSDPLMTGQGFLARFLVCGDRSLVGTRFLAGRSPDEDATCDPAVTRFWGAIDKLIRQPLPTNSAGELEPTTLAITGPAYDAWVVVHDAIEAQLSSHGELVEVRAFAAKAADNTARIAAILAYVESQKEPTPDHISRAAQLMNHYLQTMVLRTQEAGQSNTEHQARELADWIRQNGGELHACRFKHLPAAYRKAKKARLLLELLVDYGHARITGHGPNGKPCKWKLIEATSNV